MGETMPVNSLVLMLAVALLYPPVFHRLRNTPGGAVPNSWALWKFTLPLALLCWYLAYRWSEAPHPTALSLALILGTLIFFSVACASRLPAPCPSLGSLLLAEGGLLAYAVVSWAVTALAAALSPVSLETQALLLGYLLLAPLVAAVLLPQPRPPAASHFVVLSGLLLYAAGAWATIAFWGIIPTPTPSLEPLLWVLVWLAVLAVFAWIVQRLLATRAGSQVRSSAGSAVTGLIPGLRRLLPRLARGLAWPFIFVWHVVIALGIGFWRLELALARSLGRGAVWLVRVAIPALARGLSALPPVIWRGLGAPGRRVIRLGIWVTVVVPRSIARGLVAATRAIATGCVALARGLWRGICATALAFGRAAVWAVTVAPKAMARAVVAASRGIAHGFLAALRALRRGLVAFFRAIGRALVWLVTVALPGLGRGLAAAARGVARAFLVSVRAIARGLVALARAVGRAAVWLVRIGLPGAGRGVWHGLSAMARAVARGLLALARAILRCLVAFFRAIGRALVWLILIAPPAAARAVVAALRAVGYGLVALVRSTGRSILALGRALGRAAVWLVMTALPGAGRALWHAAVTAVHALGHGLVALVKAVGYGLLALGHAVARAVVWLVAVAPRAIVLIIIAAGASLWRGLLAVLRAVARGVAAAGRALGRAIVWLLVVAPRTIVAALVAAALAVWRGLGAMLNGIAAGLVLLARAAAWLVTGAPRAAARMVAAAGRALRELSRLASPARRRTVAVWSLGLLFLATALSWWMVQDRETSSTPTATPTPLPPNSLAITIVTNDTKAEWLGLVTDRFNESAVKTSAGHRIVVQMIQESSPQPTVDKIVAGEMQPALWSPADISWVEQANGRLSEKGRPPVVSEECPRIVYAATGFAMWRPMAEALGWPDKPIGWKQIAELAGDPQGWAGYGHPEWGQFKFGHAHPEKSSTGFSMLATLAYALTGKTSGLTAADAQSPAVVDAFRKVEQDTYHYGTSTSKLLNLMIARGPSYLHAVTSSETAMLYSNTHSQKQMLFPFAFIFPAEGTFWMDNPACILDDLSPEQREAATTYREYLLAFEQQDQAVTIGLRPGDPSVPLHSPISLADGTDPRVSPQTVSALANVSSETQAAIIDLFKETKKEAHVILVLDMSVSMGGEKLSNAVDASLKFIAGLAPGDRVQLYAFNNTVVPVGPAGAASDVRNAIAQSLQQVRPGGQTALNDAICMAYRSAESAQAGDVAAGEQRLYGVVVLSDGADNRSKVKDLLTCLPKGEDVQGVKVFTIAYGKDADTKLLKQISDRTNGKTFAAEPGTIEQVYALISAEQ